jgi:myo-inositol-1(or 4)-monophosphatase
MKEHDSLLKCAVETAKKTGAHALENWKRRDEIKQISQHDVKLQLDVECQEVAEASILEQFPEHGFLGEESTTHASRDTLHASRNPEYVWVVDPIDGTVNFSHGYIIWCTSIAVQYNGKTVAAAVFAPALGELYTASTDQCAMMNGQPISVSKIDSLANAMIFTGIDRTKVPGHEPYATFRAIADNVQKTRISGSAALDLCRVACGQGEGYFESDIYIWDIAAAGYIIERAGGKAEVVKELEKPHQLQYIATNGLIHDELKQLLHI